MTFTWDSTNKGMWQIWTQFALLPNSNTISVTVTGP